MDLDEALRTTGAVREFTDEAVTRDEVLALLDAARYAPSGGNRQCWHVVVVEDPERRRLLRDVYLLGWYEYVAQAQAGLVPFSPVTDRAAERAAIAEAPGIAAAAAAGPGGFAEHLDTAPVVLLVLADLRFVAAVDRDAARYTFAGGASIYPFAWSILLAARAAGLGGVITTMAARHETELREAFALREHHAVAGVLALGHPAFQPHRLRRNDVASFTTLDVVDGEALGS